jgi:membrane-bound lytic murein transglycosylase A
MLNVLFKTLILTGLSLCTMVACHPKKAEQQKLLILKPASFANLPDWEKDHQAAAFYALQNSCQKILGSGESMPLGSAGIKISIEDWRPVCESALRMKNLADAEARDFFEKWFKPYAVYDGNIQTGLFTGYYLPELNGASKKSDRFSAPLYEQPQDLVVADLTAFNPKWAGITLSGRVVNGQFIPYQTSRKDIDAGAIEGKANIIAWVDPIDRFFLQIQGSGLLTIDEKEKLFIGYGAQNGSPYTPIGKILIERGELEKSTMSMTKIREWLAAHPDQAQEVMEQDRSFVFFKILPRQQAIGTSDLPLTPGRSLAIDRQIIPLNLPLWVETTVPDIHQPQQSVPLRQLFIAQDTGGAIKGVIRADLFWGAGESAELMASRMHEQGRYWLLLPRQHSSE